MKKNLPPWVESKISGRGLAALVGKGQIFQVVLDVGEEFIIHPRNLLAYSRNTPLMPQPYRLSSNSLRLQVPKFQYHLPRVDFGKSFFQAVAQHDIWKSISKMLGHARIWLRSKIWGDRVLYFLQWSYKRLIRFTYRSSYVSKAPPQYSYNQEHTEWQISSQRRMPRMLQL